MCHASYLHLIKVKQRKTSATPQRLITQYRLQSHQLWVIYCGHETLSVTPSNVVLYSALLFIVALYICLSQSEFNAIYISFTSKSFTSIERSLPFLLAVLLNLIGSQYITYGRSSLEMTQFGGTDRNSAHMLEQTISKKRARVTKLVWQSV